MYKSSAQDKLTCLKFRFATKYEIIFVSYHPAYDILSKLKFLT